MPLLIFLNQSLLKVPKTNVSHSQNHDTMTKEFIYCRLRTDGNHQVQSPSKFRIYWK